MLPAPALPRQYGVDLDQRLFRRAGHRRTAKGADQPGTGDQRHHLIAGEHQGRQVEPGPHHIADARLAINRHARPDQVGDIAVNGARRHFQPKGQLRRRHQPTAAQMLHDLKQAVGAAHGLAFRLKQTDRIAIGVLRIGKAPRRNFNDRAQHLAASSEAAG